MRLLKTFHRKWHPFLILFTVLSFWCLRHVRTDLENDIEGKHELDAYANNVRFTQLSDEGILAYQVYATSLQHYANKITEFTQPVIIIYDIKGARKPWYIRANSGSAYEATKEIVLQGNVEAQQAADPQHPSTLLKTTTVTVSPKTRRAETTAPISAVQPGLIITAIGADTDLQTGITHLRSEVKAHYVP